MTRILQLHPSPSKAELEQTAVRRFVARQREYQTLKALARFGGLAPAPFTTSGCPLSGCAVGHLLQLEDYVEHRIALAAASGGA